MKTLFYHSKNMHVSFTIICRKNYRIFSHGVYSKENALSDRLGWENKIKFSSLYAYIKNAYMCVYFKGVFCCFCHKLDFLWKLYFVREYSFCFGLLFIYYYHNEISGSFMFVYWLNYYHNKSVLSYIMGI